MGTEHGTQSRGKSLIVSAPVSAKRYEGLVKYFRGSFGWLESEEVANKYPDADIFVHVNDCDFRPRQLDKVSFQLTEDHHGNPKAVSVGIWREPARIDARDWFGADREGRKKMRAGH